MVATQTYLIGVDIGTQGTKAALLIAVAEHVPPPFASLAFNSRHQAGSKKIRSIRSRRSVTAYAVA